jgi:hypothetical protein
MVCGRSRCASVTNRQSTTVSWAIRLVMAPERKAVSRVAVSSTKSATSVIGDQGKLVIATVVAPCARASVSASMVSTVVPVCDRPTATSPSPRSAAEVAAMCGSGHA